MSPPFLGTHSALRPGAPAAPAAICFSLQHCLLTGGALATLATLTLAASALEYGLPVVEAGPTAAGIEFHQVLVQGPAQVLLFGLQKPQVCVPQQLVDGLHLKIDNNRAVL